MAAEALARNRVSCSRCGAGNKAEDRFCERCGLAQHGVDRPTPAPARTLGRRRGLVPAIVAGTVIVVLGVAGGIFLMRPAAPAPDRVADTSPAVRALPTFAAAPSSAPFSAAVPTMPPPPPLSSGTVPPPHVTMPPPPSAVPALPPPARRAPEVSAPTAAPVPSVAPPAPVAVPAGSALRRRHAADRAAVDGLVGSWVPQISSKASGLVVRGVTYDDARIWSEFQRARATYPDVVLVRSAEFRSFQLRGHWVTVVGRPYASAAGANAWCARQGFGRQDCFAKRLSRTSGPSANTVLRR